MIYLVTKRSQIQNIRDTARKSSSNQEIENLDYAAVNKRSLVLLKLMRVAISIRVARLDKKSWDLGFCLASFKL